MDNSPKGALSDLNPPRQPFDNTRDTRYFFPSSGHAEALSRLLFLAEDRNMGMGLLTGEIGSGKTLLRTVLHTRIGADQHLRVSIENGLLGFDDLLLEIISQMRGERVESRELADRYSRLAAFKRLLTELVANRDRHLVILLDEAQQLDPASLDALKGLTNIASERQNFLTIILIGQPELRQRVRKLPQVDQRISLRYHLGALPESELAEYLAHRLEVAGYQGPFPFSAGAMESLYRASRGIPREINRIGKLGLEHVRNLGLARFSEDVIAAVVKDLRRQGGLFEASADGL